PSASTPHATLNPSSLPQTPSRPAKFSLRVIRGANSTIPSPSPKSTLSTASLWPTASGCHGSMPTCINPLPGSRGGPRGASLGRCRVS
ncbi:hypothetical protein CORC01_14038, partial [Colletotrichum orchidophilum]